MEPIPNSPAAFQARQPYTLIGPLALIAGLAVGHIIAALVHTGGSLGLALAGELRTAFIIGALPEGLGLLISLVLLARGGIASRAALAWKFLKMAALLAFGHYLLISMTVGLLAHNSVMPWVFDMAASFPGYALYAAIVIIPAAIIFVLLAVRRVPLRV